MNNLSTLRIEDTNNPYFQYAWDIYLQSFPKHEQRPIACQELALKSSNYHFVIYLQDDTPLAIIGFWELGKLLYIEHIAVTPQARGKKIGEQIMQKFTTAQGFQVVLEIDHLDDDISTRRWGFYERLGFVINDVNYSHKPFIIGNQEVELLLLSHGKKLSEEQYNLFKDFHDNVVMRYANE